MHMKYFQSLADIYKHYNEVLSNIDKPKFGHSLLETWGINPSDKDSLIEEQEVLRYLIGCQLMQVRDKNAEKPAQEIAERCFKRHLRFLDLVHDCTDDNAKKHPSKLVRDEHSACHYYLFQFSQTGWYDNLPNEIFTFENKYNGISL